MTLPRDTPVARVPTEKGRIKLEGMDQEFSQANVRTLRFIVSGLKFVEGFGVYKGEITHSRRLMGIAEPDRSDSIAVAGWDISTRKLDFHLKTGKVDDGKPASEWPIIIGLLTADAEIGHGDTWFVDCWISEPQFERLLAEFQASRARYLTVSCETDLWIRSFDEHAYPSDRVALYMLPSDRHKNITDVGKGTITDLSWSLFELLRDEGPAEEQPKQPSAVVMERGGRPVPVTDLSRIEALFGNLLRVQGWSLGFIAVMMGLIAHYLSK